MTQSVGPEQLAAHTAALKKVFDSLTRIVPSAETVAGIQVDVLPALLCAYGWCRAVLGQAAALEAIHAAGLGAEAAPIRRLMLEHVSYARWVAQDPEEATKALDDASVNRVRRLKEAAVGASMASEDDAPFLESYEEWRSSQGYLLSQQPLMKSLGLESMQAAWLVESGYSHAGVRTAIRFIDTNGSEAVLREKPDDNLADELRRSTFTMVLALQTTLTALNMLAPALRLGDALDLADEQVARALAG